MESRLIAATVTLLLAGCGEKPASPAADSVSTVERPSAVRPPEDGLPSSRAVVVFFGTSLTAGLGVDPDQAYPAIIQRKADSAGLRLAIENRGNSGETSAGALTRIDWILRAPPAFIVIETGANDGLRGQDPDSTRANIQAIIDKVRRRDSTIGIAIVGMEAMPNLGRRYVERFRAMYPELARTNGALFVPFLLDGVAGVEGLNQGDGIHPTPKGHERVAENIWQALRPTLTAISEKGPG
jgi:acyl-CoA thioesterase-1